MQTERDTSIRSDAKETLDLLHEISEVLNCQLDKHTLALIVGLIDNGANPVAVASVIKELKNEMHNNS